jgi:N-acetylglucosaminyldiphosphoundecaprenol N-acetyl-beta-D-mannosaminyltransferase
MDQAIERITWLVERGEPSYVITANLNYVMLHHQQPELSEVTRQAALILADGQPIVWQSRRGEFPLPERVAGSEMIFHLARRAAERGWGIYFLGGEPGVAQACAERLQSSYAGLRIAGVESPPFRLLTLQEQNEQRDRIRESNAQLLLVAFGQPKGERWIHRHYREYGVPVSIQLGASFDFVAGTAKRAPEVWQRVGMEWAYRMLSDPKRLLPRYAANAKFLARNLWRNVH